MGFLTPEEQEHVRHKYKMVALYRCDHCKKPIPVGTLHVVDPKKGYHKWNKSRTPRNCRSFHGREPKVTYHQGECDQTVLGIKRYKKYRNKYLKQGEKYMPKTKKDKSKKGKSSKKNVKADSKIMKVLLKLISTKPAHYSKRRLTQKFKEKFGAVEVRAALDALWAKKGNPDGKVRFKSGTNKYVLYEGDVNKSSKKHGKHKSRKDASDSSSE